VLKARSWVVGHQTERVMRVIAAPGRGGGPSGPACCAEVRVRVRRYGEQPADWPDAEVVHASRSCSVREPFAQSLPAVARVLRTRSRETCTRQAPTPPPAPSRGCTDRPASAVQLAAAAVDQGSPFDLRGMTKALPSREGTGPMTSAYVWWAILGLNQ
jgi:hypothetical protein